MVSLCDAIFLWGLRLLRLRRISAWRGRARQEGCGEECRARPLPFFRAVLVKKEIQKTLRLKSTI